MPKPPIELPAELRPSDGRFGSGPAKVPQSAVDRLHAAAPTLLGTSHRKPPVKDLVRRIRHGLADCFALPDGYEVALGNGGATLFWDAACVGLVRERSAHAVFGEFSAKFAAVTAAAPFLADPVLVEAQPGAHPDHEALWAAGAAGAADVYALTHCETSTGVAMPVVRPPDAPDAPDVLVVVDATSAAAGLPVDPAAFDAYYFSPQKGLASEGGLWVALLSPRGVARIVELAGAGRHVPAMLDLAAALQQSRDDQTLNTPAISTLFLMAEQLDALNAAGGLRASAAACARRAGHVYAWAESSSYAVPFVADPAQRSDVVCTVDLDESVPAADVRDALRANGILDVDGYRKLRRNQLRIAVFPAVSQADVERLTAAIDHVVERLAA